MSSTSAFSQSVVTYIHTDALGSVVAESDNSGVVTRRTFYDPYGAVVGGQVDDGPGYSGHVGDSATGLLQMQQRYMDPNLGVFLSVDPVSATENPILHFNRYRYANGNPYRFVDPDGKAAVCTGSSCQIDCITVITCSADYLYVGIVYGGRLLRNAFDGLRQLSESTGDDSPSLPEGLVGTPDKGSRQQGGRVNNGPLDPQNGGTGDAESDFDRMTGGKSGPSSESSGLPAGSRVGENGVIYRPESGRAGPRIDIPANGDKPHETLHYPKPAPPKERPQP